MLLRTVWIGLGVRRAVLQNKPTGPVIDNRLE